MCILLAHYTVHKVMFAVTQRAAADPDGTSFVGALHLIRDAMPDLPRWVEVLAVSLG